MPTTRRNKQTKSVLTKQPKTMVTKTKTKSVSKVAKESLTEVNLQTESEGQTAYEALLRKVQEKRQLQSETNNGTEGPTSKKKKIENNSSLRGDDSESAARIFEDDSYITMHVTSENLQKEFPYEEEDGEIASQNSQECDSQNNNATVGIKQNSRAEGSLGALLGNNANDLEQADRAIPHCSNADPPEQSGANLRESINIMQNFMVKKGLIDTSLNEDQILELMQKDLAEDHIVGTAADNQTVSTGKKKSGGVTINQSPLQALDKRIADNPRKQPDQTTGITAKTANTVDSVSEVTIYKRAVKQLDPNLDEQIEQLLQQTRLENKWKESSSSDDFIDTSDETINETLLPTSASISDRVRDLVTNNKPTKATEQEHSDKIILEVEQAKGCMYEVPGREPNLIQYFDATQSNLNPVVPSVSQIDQDYQMVDSHVEEGLKRKIQALEYVDCAKLVAKNRFNREEEGQRLEIVNKNGLSFLSPVSDHENLSINSYFRWEQAF